MLNAKIAVGLAKTELETRPFDTALQAIQIAKYYDDGSSVDQFADWVDDLSQGYIKMKIPLKAKGEDGEYRGDYFRAEYSKATTNNLVFVAEQVLGLLRFAYDTDMEIAHYNDNTHDNMLQLVDKLFDREEIEHARPIVEKLLKMDDCGFFKDIANEEWSKKLNANKQDTASTRPSKKSRKSG